jgi:hypothetical protein
MRGMRRVSIRLRRDRAITARSAWAGLFLFSFWIVFSAEFLPAQDPASQAEKSEKNQEEIHPYLEEPLKQLTKKIPELKGIHPAEDQQSLEMILEKTGKEIDAFFDHVVDLEANEEIRQERLSTYGSSRRSEPIRDNYLILRHGEGDKEDFDEFRMDENGNRLEAQDFGRGYLVTSGFALICMQFSPAHQWDSRFRYLGEQKIGGRPTYVLAYAQIPGQATPTITLSGPGGKSFEMLTQGVAWVDEENFHVVRIRTDLLASERGSGLEKQTTKVDFSEVHFEDIATPLWLPRDVNVDVKLGKTSERFVELEFKNVHRYTDYRRYRVSTKIVSPQ